MSVTMTKTTLAHASQYVSHCMRLRNSLLTRDRQLRPVALRRSNRTDQAEQGLGLMVVD